MEDVVRSTAPPQMPGSSCFPPSAPPRRRRSHLDSDTYRTLARIFSHCLQSLPDSNPVAPASPSVGIDEHGAKNPSETQNIGESRELDADSNGNSSPREDLGNNSGLSEDPVPEEPQQDDERRGCDDSGAKDTILNALEEELGRDECDSGELLDDLMSGFAGLINVDDVNVAGGAKGSCLEGESIGSKRAAVEKAELVDSESIGGLPSSVSHSTVEVIDAMLQTPRGLQNGNVEEVERDECISSELATEKADEKIAAVKNGIDQEARVCADSVINTSVTSNLSEGQVTSLGGLLDDEETEEGQIPDEFQILEPCSDSDGGCSDLGAHNSEESPIEERKKEDAANISNYDYSDRFMDASEKERISKPENNKSFSNLLEADLNYKADVPLTSASSIQNNGKPDEAKDSEVNKKKKRGPLTEERKAKKKKAKKRKRAEKEREQGVKRLKLQPIIKPKTVKYCNYYLKGRCQQGDQCKFSHDVVPLTKSEPCRYFATGTCLKGDDCPFDHQLSKYPCHNFMSKGMCIRGDNCKFSHKMSENTPAVPMNGKSDTPLSSDKPTFRKELNIKKTSPANVSYTITTSRAQLSKPMHMEANLTENCLPPPVQTPSGIRFLSFGKGSSANAIKHQEKKIDDNHSGNILFNQSFSFSAQKSPVGQCKREIASSVLDRHPANNIGTNVELHNSNSNNELGASTSRSLESELSDATKILNEFLFGNNS